MLAGGNRTAKDRSLRRPTEDRKIEESAVEDMPEDEDVHNSRFSTLRHE